jgi:CubicO group peptidase (beta-lactamase class C family)
MAHPGPRSRLFSLLPSAAAVSLVFAVGAACCMGCRAHPQLREQDETRASSGAGTSATFPPYLPPAAQDDGWTVARADAVGMSVEKLGAMERAIRAGDFPKLTSVVIARHGKLVYEGYFGETDQNTLRNTRSATKTITGMLLGIAIEKGLIAGVDAPVLGFFPDKRPFANPDPRKETITLEDFLTMSSALECNDWDDESRGNEERMYVEKDWVKFTLDLPVRKPPTPSRDGGARAEEKDGGSRAEAAEAGSATTGRHFSYCAGGVGALGGVIERAAKTPLADFAKSSLFGPLGIQHARWLYSPAGLAFSGGGLELRSRDLLKFAQLYLDGGTWKGKRLVSESWVKRSVLPHARIDDKTEYGYLCWLRSFSANGKTWPSFFMSGNGGNKVVVVPDLRLVAVLSSVNYNAKGMHVVTERLFQDHVLAAIVD